MNIMYVQVCKNNSVGNKQLRQITVKRLSSVQNLTNTQHRCSDIRFVAFE